jgi:hypothetical protein
MVSLFLRHANDGTTAAVRLREAVSGNFNFGHAFSPLSAGRAR